MTLITSFCLFATTGPKFTWLLRHGDAAVWTACGDGQLGTIIVQVQARYSVLGGPIVITKQHIISNATATDWKLRNQLTEGRGENQLDYDPMNHGSVQDSHQPAISTYSRKFISVAKSP
jgi:hypothetical protein